MDEEYMLPETKGNENLISNSSSDEEESKINSERIGKEKNNEEDTEEEREPRYSFRKLTIWINWFVVLAQITVKFIEMNITKLTPFEIFIRTRFERFQEGKNKIIRVSNAYVFIEALGDVDGYYNSIMLSKKENTTTQYPIWRSYFVETIFFTTFLQAFMSFVGIITGMGILDSLLFTGSINILVIMITFVGNYNKWEEYNY